MKAAMTVDEMYPEEHMSGHVLREARERGVLTCESCRHLNHEHSKKNATESVVALVRAGVADLRSP